jgi:hypothetical protein
MMQGKNGNKFNYILISASDFNFSKDEQIDVLRYLEMKGFIKIEAERPKLNLIKIRVLSKIEPIIRLKTLELIAKELEKCYTVSEIVRLLESVGVERNFIDDSVAKWRIFYDIFEELSISNDLNDRDLLFKIIVEAIHPLNLGDNQIKSNELRNKFNNYLNYDNLGFFADRDGNYTIMGMPSKEEQDKAMKEITKEMMKSKENELKFLQKPENKEKISTLRKAYQVLINIVEIFCENHSKQTNELDKLNNVYINIKKIITDMVWDLHLTWKKINEFDRVYRLNHYCIPFINLFTAEAEYKDKGVPLSWNIIRSQMYATYGEIDEIYQKIGGTDILPAPDKQKQLNDAILYLSELKEKIEKDQNKIKGIEEQADLKESLTQDKNFGGAQKERQSLLEVSDKDAKPYTKVIDGKGYLKFYKEGEKILIGGKNTRPFRLLQCLCEPYFGVQKTIDAVFEAIRLPKDNNDSSLTEYSPQRKTRMSTLIEYAKKELQKNKKLQKKIKFKYNSTKTRMWLELEE